MKILLINGVNLNMLGIREPDLYGTQTLKTLVKDVKLYAKQKSIKLTAFSSNSESEIVCRIQKAYQRFDAIIINAGAYTHTSLAILDALKAVNIKTIEVHLTNVNEREDYRKFSYISLFAEKTFMGEGKLSYYQAIDYLSKKD